MITNRIKRLEQKMKKVKDGQFETMKSVGANDEIGGMIDNFNLMVTSLKQLIYENYEVKIQMTDIALKKREAELYALQSQINPHFLFNTLESIRMKIYNGDDIQEASSMIFNLSKILRISLNWQGEIISLSREIEFTKYYLQINKGRYKDKLEYVVSIPDELSKYKILKLIVQPIVENALKHGIEQKSKNGIIRINAYESEDKLIIEISDNGAGMDSAKLEQIQHEISTTETLKSEGSIGIKNVNDRMVLYYGKEFGLKINSVKDEGTQVKLHLPKVK
jgi:two-component system sensor histidine kinase YesM